MESLMRTINRIARLSELYREREFKQLGLGSMHHLYLLAICRQPGITQETLAQDIFVNKSNVARQLAILETKGFITREKSPHDGRCLMIYPTKKAEAATKKIHQLLQEWNTAILAEVPKTEQEQLLANLNQILLTSEATLARKEPS